MFIEINCPTTLSISLQRPRIISTESNIFRSALITMSFIETKDVKTYMSILAQQRAAKDYYLA